MFEASLRGVLISYHYHSLLLPSLVRPSVRLSVNLAQESS